MKSRQVRWVLGSFLFLVMALMGRTLPGFPGPSLPDPDPANVSFQAEVFPIFQSKCNQVECHGRSSKVFPKYLNYGMIKAKHKDIVLRLNFEDKPMLPPDSEHKLTAVEKKAILSWIEAGLPDN